MIFDVEIEESFRAWYADKGMILFYERFFLGIHHYCCHNYYWSWLRLSIDMNLYQLFMANGWYLMIVVDGSMIMCRDLKMVQGSGYLQSLQKIETQWHNWSSFTCPLAYFRIARKVFLSSAERMRRLINQDERTGLNRIKKKTKNRFWTNHLSRARDLFSWLGIHLSSRLCHDLVNLAPLNSYSSSMNSGKLWT